MVGSRTSRGLVAIGLAIGLVVAACGGSSSTSKATGPSGAGNSVTGDGTVLVSGLWSNLDNLDSYQFAESTFDTSLSPESNGFLSGTIINKPAKAMRINYGASQDIITDTEWWGSLDAGYSWVADSESNLPDYLPGSYYGRQFDANAAQFKAVGEESKNGIQCVHYQGDSSLSRTYVGSPADFRADLWVARDGNYPVSGVLGMPANGGFGFNLTHINDPANAKEVAPPTNITTNVF